MLAFSWLGFGSPWFCFGRLLLCYRLLLLLSGLVLVRVFMSQAGREGIMRRYEMGKGRNTGRTVGDKR